MININICNSIPHNYLLGKDGKITCENTNFSKLQTADDKSFKDTLTLSLNAQQSQTNSVSQNSKVADLSKRYSFYSTGDAEQDHQIALGLEYKRSCFDFTHAKEFDEISSTQKESGFNDMSNAEKYAAIYKKYTYCYGENFLDAEAIEYVNPPISEDEYLSIIHRFKKEVNEACGGAEEAIAARRTALYGNMSDYEIRQTIMDKYSNNGEMTQRNLFKASNEMDLCGVGSGMNNALNPIGNPFIYKDPLNSENSTDIRERMLDTSVNTSFLRDIEKVYNNRITVGGYVDADFYEVLNQIMTYFR